MLAFAVMEMADSGGVVAGYLGNGTMKMVRLMKVLRPIRLLMRSQGLKTIIEALVACRKPIFYAALFLLILSSVFAVSLVFYPQTSISNPVVLQKESLTRMRLRMASLSACAHALFKHLDMLMGTCDAFTDVFVSARISVLSACVCVRARVRACLCAGVCLCVYMCVCVQVMAMALFKKKMYRCSDESFEGLKGDVSTPCTT